MKNRLFIKIFATYVILILLVVAVLDFLLTPQIREIMTKAIEDKMSGHAQIISLLPDSEIRNRIAELASFAGARLSLIDATGRVRADSNIKEMKMDNHLNRPEVQEARLKGIGRSVRYSRSLQENMLYVALPIKVNARITGYVRLARPLKEVRESIDHVYRYLYLTLFIIALPSLLLAFLFTRNITSPIRRMKEFAEKVRDGEPPGRLIMDTQDEMGQLAQDMNLIFLDQQEKVRLATEEANKLQAAFASMEEGVLILEQGNRILDCNRSLRQMLGRASDDLQGKTLLEVFRSVPLLDALNRFRKTGESLPEEIVLGDESPVIAAVNIADIQGLSGDERKIIVVFHDITRLKKLERMRSDFILNVTHELKTPLTAIIGYTETLLAEHEDNAALRNRFLGVIHDHASRMGRLVDDLLTLSNLEQGEIQLALSPLSLAQIMETVLPVIQGKAAKKNLRIEQDVPTSLPQIRGDRDKLAQVFLNVLDNAVKFTASGQITIKASSARKAGYVIFQVMDTGAGIPKSEIPRLGERFYRVDRARSRELGGTGLGLSIVKHLMKAHQGWMEIESTPGKGTTVSLTFPVMETAVTDA